MITAPAYAASRGEIAVLSAPNLNALLQLVYLTLRGNRQNDDLCVQRFDYNEGQYKQIGTYYKRNHRIQYNVSVVKAWVEERRGDGHPHKLADYYREVNACPACKGSKGTWHYDGLEWDNSLPCERCSATGEFKVEKKREYTLRVREMIPKMEGAGLKLVEHTVESGTLMQCLRLFQEIKELYNDESQFLLYNPKEQLIGVEAHREILLFSAVPDPKFDTVPFAV